MIAYTPGFQQIDKAMPATVGGKGANLAQLCRIEGIAVPPGFCVTTEAFKEAVSSSEQLTELLEKLDGLKADDRRAIAEIALNIRQVIEGIAIPESISREVGFQLGQFDDATAFAVRSSATAEDLPTASFAGQQDTYLNIIGKKAILQHISKCWASLFTERAVTYRIQNGFGHKKIYLAVVVQQMVFAQAAGIMFTADPVTANRKVLSIDAGFGLGEAMVSGLVNADVYKLNSGAIIEKRIPVKKIAINSLENGGTAEEEIPLGKQDAQVLTDEQLLALETIGRAIEKHFCSPQDIEWCLAENKFYIVQSRPITTLYPIPGALDGNNHVYISVGHQQMMTDAIKPLGLSLFQLTTARPMDTAGGRLFVDITANLSSPAGRGMLLGMVGKSDPLINDALLTIIERDFIKLLPDDGSKPVPPLVPQAPFENRPEIVEELIAANRASVAELRQNIQTRSGSAVFDFIREDMKELKRLLFDLRSTATFMAAINASAWLNEKMEEWLGEKNAVDTLSQSVPHNITSEMGLALMDVADVIRPYPELVEYLQQAKGDDFLEGMQQFNGGQQAKAAIENFLDTYGMRCAGEIDITKTRWSESPKTLIPVILTNVKTFAAGAATQKFEQGRSEALEKEQELLSRLNQLPNGEQKAAETKEKIALVRNFIGYREYPKYGLVSRYFVYKQALMKEAERLLHAGLIKEKEDVYYLNFDEFNEAVRNGELHYQTITDRKEAHKFNEKLSPPRVITSDGEIITGAYKRENLPEGAIAGLAVSSGTVEGRARVILSMEDADIEEGDILITPFTDPSWTPLFVSIKGLVTEVGGLMTHGAVIAREYGLPAVVGVEQATQLIKDGQRIRVNGTDGFVELL